MKKLIRNKQDLSEHIASCVFDVILKNCKQFDFDERYDDMRAKIFRKSKKDLKEYLNKKKVKLNNNQIIIQGYNSLLMITVDEIN